VPDAKRPGFTLLVVIRRDSAHDALRQSFAGYDDVRVISDRRHAERRRSVVPIAVERRRADRRNRRDIEAQLRTRGWAWCVVADSGRLLS
jgi:hypothetical protein